MSALKKNASASESVENLLQSYARRRELLKKSHYFGMGFPAIKPCKSAICHQELIAEDESSESQNFILSTKILPLPKRYLTAASFAVSPEKNRRYSYLQSRHASAQINTRRFTKPIEPESKIEPIIYDTNTKIYKPTVTNFTMIVTNIDELLNIEKNQSYFNLQTLTVYDIKFDQFIPYLKTIANECKHLQTLELHRCHVNSFQHLEEISQLRNLHNLLIGTSGNQITQLSCWYLYLIHRMSHLSIKNINGIKITPELCSLAAQKFGSSVQMLRLCRRQKHHIFDKQTLLQEIEDASEDENQRINCRLLSAINQMEDVVINEAARKFVEQVMFNSLESYKRNKFFHQIWPQYFAQAVKQTLEDLNKGIDFKIFIGEKSIKTTFDS